MNPDVLILSGLYDFSVDLVALRLATIAIFHHNSLQIG